VGVEPALRALRRYRPPTASYQRVLHEALQPDQDSPLLPCPTTPGAGWIEAHAGDVPPVFIAHTMIAAVWLLRESLPSDAVPDDTWAQLTQAVCAVMCTPTSTVVPATSPRPAASPRPATSPRRTPRRSAKRARIPQPVRGEPPQKTGEEETPPAKRTKRALETAAKDAHAATAAPRKSPLRERSACEDHASQEASNIAWILGQRVGKSDFLHTARHPHATADTMLRNAQSVGNETAKTHAAYFVLNWRRSGNPLRILSDMRTPLDTADPPSSFHVAMDAITSCEAALATAGIVYRWAMALVGQMYDDEMATLAQADRSAGLHRGRRAGQGRLRSQAKQALWKREKPRMTWEAYNARLKRARRWLVAVRTHGWGLLVIMPTTAITPYWVEQALRIEEWMLWLRLVERVHPVAVQASRDFDDWLGPATLPSGSLQGTERLPLELHLEARVHELTDGDDNSDADKGGHVETPHSALDLRELFRPASVGPGATQAV
jgi:hypothetical protein